MSDGTTSTEATEGGVLGADAVLSDNAKGAAAGGAPATTAPPVAAPVVVTPEQKLADDKKAADDKAAGEKKAADDKVAAEKAAKAELDKAYEAWKPAGERNPEALKEFTGVAKELGLKPEQAEKLLALNDKLEQSGQKAREQALVDERQGWFKSLKADKEFGGQKYETTIKEANKAFERYADPELKSFLKATGLDAHPGLLKSFAKIGAALRNDSLAGTESNGSVKTPQQALADLYRTNSPGMFPKS